jgi:hypothetical protein
MDFSRAYDGKVRDLFDYSVFKPLFGWISGVYVYFSDVLSATILSAGEKMRAAAGVDDRSIYEFTLLIGINRLVLSTTGPNA